MCSGELIFVDVETGETIALGISDLTFVAANISFTTQQLRENRHYIVAVEASNVAGTAISQTRISKCS